MKRMLILLCLVGLIVAVPLSHSAFAAKKKKAKKKDPNVKVSICHATDSFDVPTNGWTQIVGHVITVSENAVDAHLAHGDSTVINSLDDSCIFGLTWGQVAENNGLDMAGVNCSAFVPDFE